MIATASAVEAIFSVVHADGALSTIATRSVEVRSATWAAVDVHKALREHLRDNRMPSATYGFAWDGKFRKDVWSLQDDDFIGCTCNGADGDPACDIYACWGRAPRG